MDLDLRTDQWSEILVNVIAEIETRAPLLENVELQLKAPKQ